MKHWGVERRRALRVKPRKDMDYGLSLHGEFMVRLLDFSESGVLLASKVEVSEGDHAVLRAIARTDSVRMPVQIRHVSLRMIPATGQRFCAGASFVDPSQEQRAQLAAALRGERT